MGEKKQRGQQIGDVGEEQGDIMGVLEMCGVWRMYGRL